MKMILLSKSVAAIWTGLIFLPDIVSENMVAAG
jgi:hypothetical protein